MLFSIQEQTELVYTEPVTDLLRFLPSDSPTGDSVELAWLQQQGEDGRGDLRPDRSITVSKPSLVSCSLELASLKWQKTNLLLSNIWGSRSGDCENCLLWNITPCTLADMHGHCRGYCCLHCQGRWPSNFLIIFMYFEWRKVRLGKVWEIKKKFITHNVLHLYQTKLSHKNVLLLSGTQKFITTFMGVCHHQTKYSKAKHCMHI